LQALRGGKGETPPPNPRHDPSLLAGSITLSVARRTTASVFSALAAAMRLIGETDGIEARGAS